MKYIITLITIITLVSACQDQTNSKKTAAVGPCDLYQYLKGPFAVDHMEGTMNFSGGMSGTIEISGLDYNDMTCTYTIKDCASGTADMNCDGAPYQNTLVMISQDKVKIGESTYNRVK